MSDLTAEQTEMLNNMPERITKKKSVITKKRVLVTSGLLAGAAMVYFIGPKILKKVRV